MRNQPCPCGSGRRYKQCHGALAGPEASGHEVEDVGATIDRGMAAHRGGDLDGAEQAYRQALERDPEHPLARHYLGMILYQRGRIDDALPVLERAVAQVPAEPEFHNNLGLALAAADRLEEAIAAHRRALALRPAATAWNNLGLALAAANDPVAAQAAYREAIALQPDLAAAHWNLAMALLSAGDYAAGWREYEWRLVIPAFAPVEQPPMPRWTGEPLQGKRLLVCAEQGLGDAIQMLRLAATLAARDIEVVARVPATLAALAATVPGVAGVSVEGSAWPDCTRHVPLMSVAGIVGFDPFAAPAQPAYMHVDAARRKAAAHAIAGVAQGRRAVGLAWSGSPRYANDGRRSMPLAMLAPLLERADIAWFSLQHDDAEAVAAVPHARHLHRLDARLAFDDMATMIDALDLVVTVDTSVGHLAGALGKETWVMVPFAADWRWGVTGERSPWYAGTRLFRQHARGHWPGVVDAVAASLSADACLQAPASAAS
jgi:tetratricopeptide (TPR) repeat protein